MRLITQRTLDAFGEEHADARQALADWSGMVRMARWTTPDELIRSSIVPARIVPQSRAIFNLKGNHYRLVVSVRYAGKNPAHNGIVKVEFIGTHAEYNKIDATTVTFTP